MHGSVASHTTQAGSDATAPGFLLRVRPHAVTPLHYPHQRHPPPMHTEISLPEAIGRTIRAYAFSYDSDSLLLAFDDDTFTVLTTEQYPECEADIVQGTFSPLEYSDTPLLDTGVLTAEELQARKDERAARQKAQHDAYDRATYERLRAKFGDA